MQYIYITSDYRDLSFQKITDSSWPLCKTNIFLIWTCGLSVTEMDQHIFLITFANESHMTYVHRFYECFSMFCPQSLDIQVEDVRIRAILSSYRKRIPVTEGYVEVKDGGKWKQICNTEWNQLNSRVICGMFGFPGERRYNARVYKWVLHSCLCGPEKLKGQRLI